MKKPIIVEDFYKEREARTYENEAPTLRGDRHGLKVVLPSDASGPVTTTSTPTRSTQPYSEKPTTIQTTLGESIQGISPTSISFVQDFLANRLALQESGKVSRTLAERFSSRYAESRKLKDLHYFYLRTSRGLLSHDKGLAFQIILESLEELGYWVEWQIFNSKYFGVPQNRRRVFIIGHLRGTGGREIFPIGEEDGMAQGEDEGKTEQISLAIDRNYWKGPDKHGQRTVIGVTLANTSRYRQGVKRTPLKKDENSWALNSTGDQGVAISFTNPHNPYEERGVNLSNMSRAIKPPYGNQQPLVLADRTRTLAGKGRNLETPKLITNALSGFQKDNLLLEHLKIRRLTPMECERLQGFPDGWTEWGIDENGEKVRTSDTQRYKMLGNAVTTNVITFLGNKILEAWN